MKNLDKEYSPKIMIPQVSPFVFSPNELNNLMQIENDLNDYKYDYEKMDGHYDGLKMPFEFESLSKNEALEYIRPILNIAIRDGLTFLKKLTPEFSLYQLKEYGKDLWIEQNWINDIEQHLTDKKTFANKTYK